MPFADEYLTKQGIYKGKINIPPHSGLGIVIVIPCYNEPDIVKAIQSISDSLRMRTELEIIVVINAPVNASEEILDQNNRSKEEIDNWHKLNTGKIVHTIIEENVPTKIAGVGYARKTGMDEAIFRFNTLNRANGVIMSFDADSVVDSNYLQELEKQFFNNAKANSCVLYFEHPTDGDDFSQEVYKAVIQYELYLRYYLQAVRYTGYPYAYHTIGSCFGVKANVYIKQGGMSRRQAGEDFYFLQKVFPLGGVVEINTTRVIPSSRPSDRVPFGTGPVVRKLSESREEYMTYDFQAFKNLKVLFDGLPGLYESYDKYIQLTKALPEEFLDFTKSINLEEIIKESKENSNSYEIFKKRFFNRFNAFQILKYLNHVHEHKYLLLSINETAKTLLKTLGKDNISDCNLELLTLYRALDKLIVFKEE